MKYSLGILTTVTLFSVFILSGCESPSNKMEDAETSVIEANRDLEIATSEVEAELRIYRAENDEQIMKHERTISEIKQKIDNEFDKEVRDSLQTKLDGHEAIHFELKREIDNYKVSEREDWDDFKESFSNRMNDLGNSLKDFFSPSTTASSTN